jgi:hypothetical protein
MIRNRAVGSLEIAHIACLSMWAGSLAMTAVTAAIAFPTMKELNPTLPSFAAYPDDHWVIAAGQVMERVFTASDIGQLALAILACVLFVPLALSKRLSRGLMAARAVVLAALLVSLLEYTFVMRPQMTSDLMAFWAAAKAGELEAANAARAAFDEAHPLASARLSVHLAGVLLAIALCLVSPATASGEAADKSSGA